MMDELFENILAQLKRLQLDGGLADDIGKVLADSHDAIALAWEASIDRRVEAKVGKAAYHGMLAQEGHEPDMQEMMRLALSGRPPGGEDLPN